MGARLMIAAGVGGSMVVYRYRFISFFHLINCICLWE